MKLQLVPPSRGVVWAREGARVFFTRPFQFMGLFGAFLLAMLFSQLLWWVGSLLWWASLPLVTLGFMTATRLVLQGERPTLRVFTDPLKTDRARKVALLQLGALYAGAMLVVVLVHAGIDGGRLVELQKLALAGDGSPEAVAPILADGRLQAGMLWVMGAASVLSIPFWHAPALVHWGGQGAAKALFFSTVACWRNKGAFTLYALTGFAAFMGFTLAVTLVFTLLGARNVAVAMLMPATLLFMAVFYASLYFTFADCFEPSQTPTPSDTPTPEELPR